MRSMKLYLMIVYASVVTLELGECSYSGATLYPYHSQIRRLALSKSSSHIIRTWLPPSLTVRSNSRVYHVRDYGGDPTGTSDSTEALEAALSDAFAFGSASPHLVEGVVDLGGTQLRLDGGTYLLQRPLRFPHSGGGNFTIYGGSLRASDDFPREGHVIEIHSRCSAEHSLCYEDITLKDLMIDSNFRGGGISIKNSIRIMIHNCYVSHFRTHGIQVKGGHESYITNCFIGQHINAGGDHREKDFSGIGIQLDGNDNGVTDVVIFSASIGVMVSGEANIMTGVHCYNKASGLGGVGIYVSTSAAATRIVNCYLDFTGIAAEDPVQLQVTGSLFLGNAFVSIKSLKGIACGVNIVDNMFCGDYTGVPIVQLDQAQGLPFANIDQVVVDRNSVRGMLLKSTVAKASLSATNATSWTLDFSPLLLFPDLIHNLHYTIQLHPHYPSTFPILVLRNVSANQVTLQSNQPVSATLHVMADQSMLSNPQT